MFSNIRETFRLTIHHNEFPGLQGCEYNIKI